MRRAGAVEADLLIHVVGGTYRELCRDPAWSEVYGSGVRAAAALSQLSDGVELSTYIDPRWADTLASVAALFGLRVNAWPAAYTATFSYPHPLASPVLYPERQSLVTTDPITVDAQCILRFGMLETDAVVHGERVTYDPQSDADPRPFAESGSTAEALSIVANQQEGATLSGAEDPREIGRALIEEGADVVVIKRGSAGASVVTDSGEAKVPAYLTQRVWPIGSGDVFTAVFAHFWGERRLDPAEAARRASLAAAYYCNSQVLPIPSDLFTGAKFHPVPMMIRENADPVQVYLAAPFFSMGQRWMLEAACAALEAQGVTVFSPFHSIGPLPPREGAPADLHAIRESALVYAILAGWDPGTLYEVGYARAHGIPVIAWSEDLDLERRYMLEGDNCEMVEDFSSSIYRAAWRARMS